MSKHLSTSFFRFCLVGLLAAARLLCPCPAVESASAAEPQQRKAHACCDESKTGARPDRHDTNHSTGGGCEHCPDAPQLKPAATDAGEGPVVATGQTLVVHDFIERPSALSLAPHRTVAHPAPHPPQTLSSLRTVVLLV